MPDPGGLDQQAALAAALRQRAAPAPIGGGYGNDSLAGGGGFDRIDEEVQRQVNPQQAPAMPSAPAGPRTPQGVVAPVMSTDAQLMPLAKAILSRGEAKTMDEAIALARDRARQMMRR
jgi:hypothetical protein